MPQVRFFEGLMAGERPSSLSRMDRRAGDDGEKAIQNEIDRRGWRGYLADPNFRFTPVMRSWANQMARKIRGAEPDDLYQDLYMSLALPPSAGGEGNAEKGLWKFDPGLGKPLDGFWNYIVKNRAMTLQRDEMGERTRMPTTPLMNAKEEGDSSPGISEQTLPGRFDSPTNIVETKELLTEFRDWLRTARLGDTLVKIWDVLMEQAQEHPHAPFSQKEMAERVGMTPGKFNHYYNMILDNLTDYSLDEPSLRPMALNMLDRRKEPQAPRQKGPRKGYYNVPGQDPIPVEVVRMGVQTINIRRADGTPWPGGTTQMNVPRSQVELS
jgi:hypothetical protein